MYILDILVDINNIESSLTALHNNADDNDTYQQATSNNVMTDSDPALEYDARENDGKWLIASLSSHKVILRDEFSKQTH